MAGTQSVQLPTSKPGFVACVRNRHNTQIDTDKVLHFAFFDIGHVNGSEQEPESVSCYQVRFASPESKQFALTVATHKANRLATVNSPNTNLRFGEIVSENSVIERDRTKRPELALSFLIRLVSVGHLGYQANNYLGRKRELFTNRFVPKSVKRELAKFFGCPSLLTEPITSAIRYLKRALKSIGLERIGLQFDLNSQFHQRTVSQIFEDVKSNPDGIPPPPKGGGFLPSFYDFDPD
jgi:hypothetical protein